MGWILTLLLSVQPAVPPQADWRVHATPHCAIYYTADVEAELARVAPVAERAYAQISGDLRRQLPFEVTLVLFKTQAALDQQRTSPPGPPEHVLLALDRPFEELTGRITHELTHVFQFHLWPQSVASRVPPWVSEGLAEYERGEWSPSNLAQLRAAVRRDELPRLTALQAADAEQRRLIDNLGHAAFEFIGARYGKQGIRQFVSALADEAPSSDPYQEAFGRTEDEFARAFELYLKDRFRS